ncbi:hypothetical protein H9Q74_014487, partial [Fusarium xylarioides]
MVVALVNLLPSASYHVFMDNLFSSPSLYRILRDRGVGATGTARVDCGIYEGLVKLKKADNEGKLRWPWGKFEAVSTPDDKVNQIAWKDNALVLFMTSVFTGAEIKQRTRKRPTTTHSRARAIKKRFSEEGILNLWIPSVSAEYNEEMGAVDLGDQYRSYLHYDHRVRKGGWRAI